MTGLSDHCRLCGHACGTDRAGGGVGPCGAGPRPLVAAALLHHGEEPPISGTAGSGTIFFAGCPLSCVFCQNHQISQERRGRDVSVEALAEIMLDLAAQGAHNVNLVSPTPHVPLIARAVERAGRLGLGIPLVYNTGGYDSPEALGIMDGLVDIYLPDAKYADPARAERYSGAADYPDVNRAALEIMMKQVGPLTPDDDGLAARGVLIRHLVLPGGLEDTGRVLADIARRYGPDTWLSLMAQYRPMYKTAAAPGDWPELDRPLTEDEYDRAMDMALELGLENTFVQELTSVETYVPDFDEPSVFASRSLPGPGEEDAGR